MARRTYNRSAAPRTFGHVSRGFGARRSAGHCPLCANAFGEGEQAVFLKAHVPAGTVRPTRLLDTSEQATFRTLFRQAQREGYARGILPRRGRDTRPVSLAEVGMSPTWLFDHMVHLGCLPSWAPRPQGETTARPGTRTEGVMHGVERGLDQVPAAPAPELVAAPAPQASEAPQALRSLEAEAAARVEAARQAEAETAARQARLSGWIAAASRDVEATAERERAIAARRETVRQVVERNRALNPALFPAAPAPALGAEGGVRGAGLELEESSAPVAPEVVAPVARWAGLEID